jgi:hypothetical protein
MKTQIFKSRKWLLLLAFSFLNISFQNCARTSFSTQAEEALNTELPVVTQTLPAATILPATVMAPAVVAVNTVSAASCVANRGQSCPKTIPGGMTAGCPASAPICASFIGIYYDSNIGCGYSPSGGLSSVEYQFDGTNVMSRAFNNNPESNYVHQWAVAGNRSSAYHCTNIGSGMDAFQVSGNGSCELATNYGIPNTYIRVVRSAASECSFQEAITTMGTVACDGSCQ